MTLANIRLIIYSGSKPTLHFLSCSSRLFFVLFLFTFQLYILLYVFFTASAATAAAGVLFYFYFTFFFVIKIYLTKWLNIFFLTKPLTSIEGIVLQLTPTYSFKKPRKRVQIFVEVEKEDAFSRQKKIKK